VKINMEIIAQAAVGISKFLHPDYVSAVVHDPFKIDFFDGYLSKGETILTFCSIAGIIILVILIANYISILRNRS